MTTGAKTVTILFTDLVGSTELLQEAGDERAQRIFKAHHRLLSEAVQRHGGHEVKWLGDGLMVAFDSAQEAVRCAIAMQQAARRPMAGERLQIRAGLNVGEALTDESDYFGTSVVVARRLCDSAEGGQIYASDIVVRLLDGLSGDINVSILGPLDLKGITNPVPAVEIGYQQDPMAMLRKLPFVGRQAEYEKLLSALSDAERGQGSVVLIAGEPGIGKTRLTEEFCDHASSSATVIRGNSYEGDIAAPFGPWVEALDLLINQLSDEELREAAGEGAPDLASLLPQVRRRLPDLEAPPKLDPESERARLFESINRFLHGASEQRPLVIFLDDLHWCDKPSLALLEQVARGIGNKRIMIVGTYRDVEVDRGHPLEQTLATLLRLEHHRRILLTGFSEESVYDLLNVIEPSDEAEAAKRALAGVLYGEARGHPFFMREVMIDLVESGKLVQQDGVWTGTVATIEELGIPQGVKEAIERRLSGLSEGCKRMLQQASALTGGFTWDELQAVSGDSEDDLLDALDEALGAQLLEEQGKLSYRFTHALIRATLYDELSAPRRVRLHGRIAGALESLYADDLESHLGELAAHYVEAGSDMEKAIEYSVRAGRRAMEVAAWEEAAAHFQRALDAMPEDSDDDRRCRVLIDLGEVLVYTGKMTDAADAYRAAAAAARLAGSGELLGEAACGFEEAAYFAPGDTQPLRQRLELIDEALGTIGSEDSALRARLLAQRSLLALAVAGTDDAVRSGGVGSLIGHRDPQLISDAREAVAMAERVGDAAVIAESLSALLRCLNGPGRKAEKRAAAEKWIECAQRAAHRRLEAAGWNSLFSVALRQGDMATVRRAYDEGNRLAEETKIGWVLWGQLAEAAGLLAAEGRLSEAETATFEALRLGETASPANAVSTFGAQLFVVRWHQGRLADVESMFRNIVEQSPNIEGYQAALALILAETNRKNEASSVLEALVAKGVEAIPEDTGWNMAMALLGEVCARVGDRAAAGALYDAASRYPDENATITNSVALGALARTLGQLAMLLERWEDAERHFEDAFALNESMGNRPALARTRLNYGEMLLKRAETEAAKANDRERAHALLEEALAFAKESGMGGVQRDAERALGLSDAPVAVGDTRGTVVAESIDKSFAGGRYVAKRLLGQGAQKSVYLVHDTTLNRECAISVLNPALLDHGDIERIKQEAQTMAQFGTHPNIVTVYDYGEEDGAPYVACEYVSGGELRAELTAAGGALSIERAVGLASDLCRALSFAHGKGIVHRDLKPENVWLTQEGNAKLGDFGIALAAGRTRLTMPGGASGTPLYMAPEQASGGEVDARTDLYALGALLYELVTGRPPFTGDDSNAIIYQHVNNAPEPPSTHNASVPESLEQLIMRLLAKEPAERPSSAGQVLAALGAAGD